MAQHIDDFIEDQARKDAGHAVAYAVLQLARAQKDAAIAIKNLDLINIADEGASTIAAAIRDTA